MSKQTSRFAALVAGMAAALPAVEVRRPYCVPKDRVLACRARDVSQHNVLRFDQVERCRKVQRKANYEYFFGFFGFLLHLEGII